MNDNGEVDMAAISPPISSTFAITIDDLCWRSNAQIHQLYTSQDFPQCQLLIEQVLRQTKGQCEFALLVKGKIRRHLGYVHESLELFQAAAAFNPTSCDILKEVGRSLFLLGRFESALRLYMQIEALDATEQWDVIHQKGLCLWRLRRLPEALECFQTSNQIQRHDSTFMMLGRVLVEMGQLSQAAVVYAEANECSPDNAAILTTLGRLHLKMGDTFKAFDHLGNALTHNSKDGPTILAAASVIQDHNDVEVALIKYRVAAVQIPTSAPLWNNIGLCFYSRSKFVAAISCLKRALYLDPFQWTIAFNLGLTYLKTRQFASAYHYLSASINLKQDNGASYMHLGIALYHLNDHGNTRAAFQHALRLAGNNMMIRLNHAIILAKFGDRVAAAAEYKQFRALWDPLDDTQRNQYPGAQIQQLKLESKLAE